MISVEIERLNEIMNKENIDKNTLELVTRKNIYKDIIAGNCNDRDLNNVADVLGISIEELCDCNNEKKEYMENSEYVSIDLYKEIEKLGFGLKCFCEYTDLPLSGVSGYQHKKCKPTRRSIEKLCYGLNCSEDYLFGKTSERGRNIFEKPQSKYMIEVSPLLAKTIKSGKATPNKIAKQIGIPHSLLKKAISIGSGKLPIKALKTISRIYNVKYEDLIIHQSPSSFNTINKSENKKSNSKKKSGTIGEIMSDDTKKSELDKLLDYDRRMKEMKRIADDLAKEKSKEYPVSRLENDKKVISMAMPKNGMVSLTHLSAIVDILNRKPELIQLFAEIADLKDEDYSHIKDHIEWLLGTIKNKGSE